MVKHEVTIELPENVWQELDFPMNDKLLIPEDSRIVLRMQPFTDMTDDQFFEFCRLNRELRIEQTKEGNIIIMPPTGGATSWRNSELIMVLGTWARQNKVGVVFDSSGGFILPNGAKRSPDASWVKRSRLASLTKKQKQKLLPLCPDFVIELRSPSDTIAELQSKMEEYLENGAQLGWLIDPPNKRVYIYHPDNEVESLENPERISGDPVLPGFVLNVQEIWTPDF
jgi:Uma2 family endonuclease